MGESDDDVEDEDDDDEDGDNKYYIQFIIWLLVLFLKQEILNYKTLQFYLLLWLFRIFFFSF
jgi:hypothetical protein